MSRALLMPHAGNPFIANAQVAAYTKLYKKNVDKLYVYTNGSIPPDLTQYNIDIFTQLDALVLNNNRNMEHGSVLSALVNICTDDHIMFIEDDFFVLQSNNIVRWFTMIEKQAVDAVVSPRLYLSDGLQIAAMKKFNLQGTPYQEQPCFWPCLCIISKDSLEKTNKLFSSFNLDKGDVVRELDFICQTREFFDTFGWFSLELRSMGYVFHYEDQNRVSVPLTINDYDISWIHFGNIHGIMQSHLINRPLSNRTPELLEHRISKEWQVALWASFCELFPIPKEHKCSYFNDFYMKNIQEYIQEKELNEANINKNKLIIAHIFKPIL